MPPVKSARFKLWGQPSIIPADRVIARKQVEDLDSWLRRHEWGWTRTEEQRPLAHLTVWINDDPKVPVGVSVFHNEVRLFITDKVWYQVFPEADVDELILSMGGDTIGGVKQWRWPQRKPPKLNR